MEIKRSFLQVRFVGTLLFIIYLKVLRSSFKTEEPICAPKSLIAFSETQNVSIIFSIGQSPGASKIIVCLTFNDPF